MVQLLGLRGQHGGSGGFVSNGDATISCRRERTNGAVWEVKAVARGTVKLRTTHSYRVKGRGIVRNCGHLEAGIDHITDGDYQLDEMP